MLNISSLIRQDGEFLASVETMREAFSKSVPLPVAINGLSGGAEDAYLVEAVKEARRLAKTVVVLVGNDAQRERVNALLCRSGVNSVSYKSRDLVFYNIYASHDIDRERLSVLYSASEGEVECIVSTPAAALSVTMPKEMLKALSLKIEVGSELSPTDLAQRLVSLGFAPSMAVEGKGQFSKRGGILDLWGADMEEPVRVEFFGDEVDRIVGFDPLDRKSVV